MRWIIIILAANLLVTFKHAIYRTQGVSLTSVLLVLFLLATAEVAYWKGMRMAPSFFQPWFLGLAALVFFGLATSWIIGDSGITTRHYIGVVLAIGASCLLVS
jgi:predicted Abi (CAAX) family protease